MENLTLSRQVEELQGQLHCQQAFQENSISLEAKLRTAVEEVKRSAKLYIEEELSFVFSIKALVFPIINNQQSSISSL
jgi:hypothetical protein